MAEARFAVAMSRAVWGEPACFGVHTLAGRTSESLPTDTFESMQVLVVLWLPPHTKPSMVAALFTLINGHQPLEGVILDMELLFNV